MSKPRRVSRSPEWAENAYWHPNVDCYVHGLEVFRAARRARLYVSDGDKPDVRGLAAILNAVAPETTFAEIIAIGEHGSRVSHIMANAERHWRAGEPLDGDVDPMGEGVLIRLPAITGRPQYSGSVMRREDRPGIAALLCQPVKDRS